MAAWCISQPSNIATHSAGGKGQCERELRLLSTLINVL